MTPEEMRAWLKSKVDEYIDDDEGDLSADCETELVDNFAEWLHDHM